MGAVIVADVTHDYGGSDPPPILKPKSNSESNSLSNSMFTVSKSEYNFQLD